MPPKVRQITEKMVTAQELRERWTGVINTEFADGIDAACNRLNPKFLSDDLAFPDFPVPFWLIKATEDKFGSITCHCLPCAPDFTNGEQYEPKYTVRYINNDRPKYNFKKLVFLSAEVSIFENTHPEVFHKRISIHKNEEDYGEDIQEELEKIKEKNKILREKNKKLLSELDAIKKLPLCDGKGALKEICSKRRISTPENEIAEFLKARLSFAQVGVLLHENPLCVSQDAITIHAKRLLGKA